MSLTRQMWDANSVTGTLKSSLTPKWTFINTQETANKPNNTNCGFYAYWDSSLRKDKTRMVYIQTNIKSISNFVYCHFPVIFRLNCDKQSINGNRSQSTGQKPSPNSFHWLPFFIILLKANIFYCFSPSSYFKMYNNTIQKDNQWQPSSL